MAIDDHANPDDRLSAAQAVARDTLRRRVAGNWVADGEILDAHPHLLPELRQELNKVALIQRATERTAALASSAGAELPASRISFNTPDRFRGYRIVREIARGGQGAVYEAIQSGTQRRVAIKVIHRSRDGGSDSARFEQEARFLARLRHPNIVTIHESGALDGDDYLVMDFVEGESLSEWIEGRARSIVSGAAAADVVLRDTVGLLATVCEAVHAAHLRGIIHRDLKPANIRVTAEDRPVVLDFGLAKRMASAVDDPSSPAALTESGQFVGSLPWSSPEQAAGRIHDMDLRTDVYALGVILYQAICGRFPYEVRGPLADVIHRILNADPASIRSAQNSPVARCVSRDLECIALRALAKAPERRYQGAGDLASDLRRYLTGDAIDARRDSAWYVFRKTLRRHRVAAAIVCAFVTLAVAAAVVFAFQAEQIRAQRDLARAAGEAEHSARVSSERVTAFLENLLSAADPFADPAYRRDVTLLTAVNLAAERVEHEFAKEPLIEASVRTVIGRTYRELGELDRAEQHFQVALERRRALLPPGHRDIAETLHEFALLRQVQTRYADALEMSREALEIRSHALGDSSAEAAQSHNLNAHLLRELRQYEQAEVEARHALEIRRAALSDDDPQIAESLNALAGVLREQGALEKAEDAYAEALDRRRAGLGPRHPDVATSLNNLATLRGRQARWADAEPLLREALSIYVERVGETHPYVARGRVNLAAALAEQGKIGEAESEYRAALAVRAALDNGPSADTAAIEYRLAKMLIKEQRDADARPLLERAVPGLRATLGEKDALTRRAATMLIALYKRQHESQLARDLMAEFADQPSPE